MKYDRRSEPIRVSVVTSAAGNPVRKFDYAAWRDSDEPDDDGNMVCGFGATEAEAILDLKQREESEYDVPE